MNVHESAFPADEYYDEKRVGCSSGLTKREYIATAMMQTLLNGVTTTPDMMDETFKLVSTIAVKAADCLLDELRQTSAR